MIEHLTEKKKMVFLLNDMQTGGVQKSIIALLKYLVGRNQYEIDLIIWEQGGILEKEVPSEVNIIYHSYPPTLVDIKKEKKLSVKTKYLFQYIRFKWFSVVLQKPWCYFDSVQKQYDIAVSFVHRGYPLFYTIDKIFAKKKVLWFHHGIYEATEKQKALDKVYFRLYDKIIAVSESNQAEMIHYFPELRNKLEVISNLIDIEDIRQKAEEANCDIDTSGKESIFVTVSRISKEKGIDLALDVASILKEKRIKFKWYFVGDGPLLSSMKEKALALHLSDNCIFLGAKSNPYSYMKQADFYIQTSFVEAHPITINEALVLKKIIIATNLNSVSAVLQNDELGMLCEPNVDVFANSIEQLMYNDTLRKQLQEEVDKHTVSNEIACKKINELVEL